MPKAITVKTDPLRNLIRIVGYGFFTLDDVAAFGMAYDQAMGRLRCEPHQHVIFADTSAMHIQSQDVVTALATIASDPRRRSRRMAVVVGHSLARSQTKRISNPGSKRVGFFDDSVAAEAWLFSDVVSADRTASRYRDAPTSPMWGDHGCTARSAG